MYKNLTRKAEGTAGVEPFSRPRHGIYLNEIRTNIIEHDFHKPSTRSNCNPAESNAVVIVPWGDLSEKKVICSLAATPRLPSQ
jgi:hypothetical protein